MLDTSACSIAKSGVRTLMKACALKVRRSWMSAKMRLRTGLRGATASPLLPSCSSNTWCSTASSCMCHSMYWKHTRACEQEYIGVTIVAEARQPSVGSAPDTLPLSMHMQWRWAACQCKSLLVIEGNGVGTSLVRTSCCRMSTKLQRASKTLAAG